MVDAASSLLPFPVPVNHLGMYRTSQLEPVEYYNNLSDDKTDGPVDLAIVVDPIIATGVTCLGAIESLLQYGAKKIVVLSVLCAETGMARVATHYPDVDFWVGGCDPGTDDKGWIRPGMGDVGDRLFQTVGKLN
jgi:uracil phosphoribosyltransferase